VYILLVFAMEKKSNKKSSSKVVLYRNLSANAPRSYSGQQIVRMNLPGSLWPFAIAGGAGVCAFQYTMDPTTAGANNPGVKNWATRVGMFDEYRVVKIEFDIYTGSLNSTGAHPNNYLMTAWVDEASSAAPTATDASERIATRFVVYDERYPRMNHVKLRWKAHDLNDLDFTPVGTAFSPVTFKIYGDSNTCLEGVIVGGNVQLGLVKPVFTIEFRGLKGV